MNGDEGHQGDGAVVLEALRIIGHNGIRVWLHGGWALDALSGTVRDHSDVDMLAEEKDREGLLQIFKGHVLGQDMHKIEVEFDHEEIEITFFQRTRNDRLVTVTPRIIVCWPPDTIAGKRRGKINGAPVDVVSPTALYMELANTVRKKQAMKDKNKRDLENFKLLNAEERLEAQKYFPRENNLLNRMRLRFGI